MTQHDNDPQLFSKEFFADLAEEATFSENAAFKWLELEESSSKGFHDLYLQRDGIEFMTPIVFEDGMDFTECELYYASMKAQDTGGSFRGLGLLERQSSLREFRNHHSNLLEPCLRNTKRSRGVKSDLGRKVRRCSFGGLPKLDKSYERPFLMKANSSRSIVDHKPTVAFEEYVHVITIHSIDDLPFDVRSQMWISKQDMLQGMRGAARERLRSEHAKARQEHTDRASSDSTVADSVQIASIEVQ